MDSLIYTYISKLALVCSGGRFLPLPVSGYHSTSKNAPPNDLAVQHDAVETVCQTLQCSAIVIPRHSLSLIIHSNVTGSKLINNTSRYTRIVGLY